MGCVDHTTWQDTASQETRTDNHGDPLPDGAIARMGDIHLWHSVGISSIAYSVDGKILASGGCDGTLRLWETATGREIRRVGEPRPVSGSKAFVAFSPDGKSLAFMARDGKRNIRLYEMPSGKELAEIPIGTSEPLSLEYSPDGKSMVAVTEGGAVQLWDVKSKKEIIRIPEEVKRTTTPPLRFTAVAFMPDGKTLALTSNRNSFILWDLQTLAEKASFQGSRSLGRAMDVTSDGSLIAATYFWGGICLLEVETGKTRTFGERAGDIECIAFSPDGSVLASGGRTGETRLWDIATGKELFSLRGHGSYVASVRFSPDARTLATAGLEGRICLWDKRSRRRLLEPKGHGDVVRSLSFSPDGKTLVSGSLDRTVRLWEVESGKPLRTILGHKREVASVEFSPSGTEIVSSGGDGTIRIWKADTGFERSKIVASDRKWVTCVSYSCDGKILASGDEEGFIRLWSADTGEPIRELGPMKGGITSLALSRDGTTLAAGCGDLALGLWDLAAGKELPPLEGFRGPVQAVAFSPDGNLLVSGGYKLMPVDGVEPSDATIRFWNVKTSKLLLTINEILGPVSCLRFSPDGKHLASADNHQYVRIWDVATGREVARLKGHENIIYCLAYSPDGRRLASGCYDGTILIWDVRSVR